MSQKTFVYKGIIYVIYTYMCMCNIYNEGIIYTQGGAKVDLQL